MSVRSSTCCPSRCLAVSLVLAQGPASVASAWPYRSPMVDSGPSGRWTESRQVRGLVATLRHRGRREQAPNLWAGWAAAPVVLALGGVAACLVFRWLKAVAVPTEVAGGQPRVDALEVIQTTLTVLAFGGALLVGLYAYQKLRLAERDATRADAQQFA